MNLKKIGSINLKKIGSINLKKIGSIHYFGYRFLGDTPVRYFPFSQYVRKSLNVAHYRISFITYISSMFFWAFISMMITAIVSFPLTFSLSSLNVLSNQIWWPVYPLGATLGAGAIAILLFLYYPHSIAGAIKTALNKNLIYIINYMSILAGAGVTTEDIFTSLAENGEVYKVEGSARSIVRDIEILGKDVISAMDDESANTPSKKYSKILKGIIGVTRTGGNLQNYLKEEANRQVSIRRRELSKLVSNLNLAAEAYVVLGIAFPVILTTLLSMMGVFGGTVMGGLNPVQVMTLMTYVFFPLAAVGVILLIDGMTSSW